MKENKDFLYNPIIGLEKLTKISFTLMDTGSLISLILSQ